MFVAHQKWDVPSFGGIPMANPSSESKLNTSLNTAARVSDCSCREDRFDHYKNEKWVVILPSSLSVSRFGSLS